MLACYIWFIQISFLSYSFVLFLKKKQWRRAKSNVFDIKLPFVMKPDTLLWRWSLQLLQIIFIICFAIRHFFRTRNILFWNYVGKHQFILPDEFFLDVWISNETFHRSSLLIPSNMFVCVNTRQTSGKKRRWHDIFSQNHFPSVTGLAVTREWKMQRILYLFYVCLHLSGNPQSSETQTLRQV